MNTQAYQQPVGIGQTLYQDAASLGQFKALVVLILGGVISVALILVGLYQLSKGNVYISTVNAKVTQVTGCMKTNVNGRWQYNCTASLEYIINDKQYQNTINFLENKSLEIGNTVSVYYNINDPSDIVHEKPISGWLFIAFSIFVFLSCYLIYWLSHRYQFFAAAEGASFITNLFR